MRKGITMAASVAINPHMPKRTAGGAWQRAKKGAPIRSRKRRRTGARRWSSDRWRRPDYGPPTITRVYQRPPWRTRSHLPHAACRTRRPGGWHLPHSNGPTIAASSRRNPPRHRPAARSASFRHTLRDPAGRGQQPGQPLEPGIPVVVPLDLDCGLVVGMRFGLFDQDGVQLPHRASRPFRMNADGKHQRPLRQAARRQAQHHPQMVRLIAVVFALRQRQCAFTTRP